MFACFHRLAEAVPTSRKPEPRAEKQPARVSKQLRPHAQLLDVVTREPLHKTVVGPELGEVKAQIRSFLDRTR